MAEKVDLINRDPNSLNPFLEVSFDDVFAEPDGIHSSDCVWKNASGCFRCGKNCCYKLMTFFCGLCIALCWGWTFACVSCEMVWCSMPCLRCLSICVHPFKKCLSICLAGFCAPCCQTCGMCFSRIHVVNSTGPAPRDLDSLEEPGKGTHK